MMRHPSVKLQILVNELSLLFSFRWSLFAVIHFHNDFIVMNYLFILLVIHSNYFTVGLRSLFTFWSLFAYICMYLFWGRGFVCHGTWVDIREKLAEVCFLLLLWVLSPEVWAHLIRLDDQHLYFRRHLPGMKIERCFSSSMKFPALWPHILLPSRWFPFNPIRWMKWLNALYHASRHFYL